ncbi:hypothetical protein Ciccas_001434 [Cichlidogyrus casuarinus]|uniref:PDZ domain-containing protein n=1 Tax=Cichlidogyrus casuarinus TaxID=1844966 RepID=A0ABD2QL68_9PLAT
MNGNVEASSRKSSLLGPNIVELRSKFTRQQQQLPLPDYKIPPGLICEDEIHLVGIPLMDNPSEEELGFCLASHRDSNMYGCFIYRLLGGSQAALSDLQAGDEIVQVNEEVIDQIPFQDACAVIRREYQTASSKQCANRDASRIVMLFVVRRNPLNAHWMNSDLDPDSSPILVPISQDNDAIIDRHMDNADNKEIITVDIERSDKGYGLLIVNVGPNDQEGVFVKGITKNTPAFKLNVFRVMDQILAVNGKEELSYDEALTLVRESKDKVRLKIARQISSASASPKKKAVTLDSSPTILQSKSKIIPNVPCDIELHKDPKSSLGFSIVGGQETSLEPVTIYEIFKDSIAWKDGRMRPGDYILRINEHDLANVTHTEATNIIRNAKDSIKLRILRKQTKIETINDNEESDYNTFEVSLKRRPTNGLGIVLLPRVDKPSGVVIVNFYCLPLVSHKFSDLFTSTCGKDFGFILRPATDFEFSLTPNALVVEQVFPNTSAQASGSLQQGDRLYAIDREPVDWLTCQEMDQFLTKHDDLNFIFGRIAINHKAALQYQAMRNKALRTTPVRENGDCASPPESAPKPVFGFMSIDSPYVKDSMMDQPILEEPIQSNGQENVHQSDAESENEEIKQLEERFLTPEHTVRLIEQNTNANPSIAIRLTIGLETNVPAVYRVYHGGAGYFAGLLEKDRIIGINNRTLDCIFEPAILKSENSLALALDQLWVRKLSAFNPMVLRVISNVDAVHKAFPVLEPIKEDRNGSKKEKTQGDSTNEKSGKARKLSVPKFGDSDGAKGGKSDGDGGGSAAISFGSASAQGRLDSLSEQLKRGKAPLNQSGAKSARRESVMRPELQAILGNSDLDIDISQTRELSAGQPLEQLLQEALAEGVAYTRSTDMTRMDRDQAKRKFLLLGS